VRLLFFILKEDNMSISKKIETFMEKSSWIRKMFEEGIMLKNKFGAENVFDFSLGNPNLEPPLKFKDTINNLLKKEPEGMHRYMPNAGFEFVRDKIANYINENEGSDLDASSIIMCCGAGAGLNVVLKALLDEGDEVLTISPFFVEYNFYANNNGGILKLAESNEDFSINFQELEEKINEKTKALIINSPNNPTGRIYYQDEIDKLAEILEKKSQKYNRPIYLISDEPYKKLVFEDVRLPSILKSYKNSIIINSFSKDLSLAGERIGYIAVNKNISDYQKTIDAVILCNRILGFVNAPALMQRVVSELLNESADLSFYKTNRDILYNIITDAGFQFKKPEGAFYFFIKSPIEDDVEFVRIAQKHKILIVPGSGFGRKGYFRVSYCVSRATIENSANAWKELAENF
jgi:aspartate aminotransferase